VVVDVAPWIRGARRIRGEGWLTRRGGQEVIDMVRALALILFLSLGVSLSYGTADTVLAKKDSTS
jgi:hypothetical protein